MANLHNLLQTLRSPIFNTVATTSNARTGAKYLKRRLRAPAALAYVPHMPSIKGLNRNEKWNVYAGWDGLAQPGQPGHEHQLPQHMVVPPPMGGLEFEEVERSAKPGPPRLEKKLAGWIEDRQEYIRFDDVARRNRLGKGPPRKGEYDGGGVRLVGA